MEEELASLKRVLISLVVSSPTTMTVNSLVKDYRNMMGGALPTAKFGYRDYITFLKERCQDIFVIEGSPWDPILTPKVTNNLKHIDQMVQKQRVQPATKHKGKRRSVPGQRNSEPVELNLIAKTFNKNDPQRHSSSPQQHNNYQQQQNSYQQKQNSYQQRLNGNSTNTARETKYKTQISTPEDTKIKGYTESRHENIKSQMSSTEHVHKEPSRSTTAINNETENINNDVEEDRSGGALSKFYKKRMPQYSSHMEFTSSEHISGRQSSSSSSSKQARLDELRAEILAIITDSADGVWYTDLGRLYKERYGRELSLSGGGSASISSVVSGLQDRVSISRPVPAGDWLLQDGSRAGAGRAGGVAEGAGARRAALYRAAPGRGAARDAEEALPGIEFEADVFPEDCMHYMDTIPGARVGAGEGEGEEAGAGMQFEVLIGEVYSPSHFWMLRVGARHNLAMEDIMDAMTEYYNNGEGAGRVLARGAIRVGQHCASLYDADWHRALVVKLIDSDTVKVRHVDYGTVDTVPAAALKPLKRCWAALPAQALRARLAGCRPCAAGRRWPRASCAGFLARVRDKRLYANVVALDAEEDILETFLIDTSGPRDACLTRELIRLGHADARPDSALRSDDSYLYPRFEILESGETLNYAEIQSALANGIALDYVDAYRRHVPVLCPQVPSAPPIAPDELLNRIPLLRIAEPASPPPREPHPTRTPPAGDERAAGGGQGGQTSQAWQSEEQALEVRLSAAEWTVLSHLRAADPAAAHWYLLTAAWRSLLPPPPPPPGF